MLAMLATSIFLLGFMYSTMQPLARCSDFNKNSETEFLRLLMKKFNFHDKPSVLVIVTFVLLVLMFIFTYVITFATTYIIDEAHDTSRSDLRKINLQFIILVTGIFTFTVHLFVFLFGEIPITIKTEYDAIVASFDSTISARLPNYLCSSINNVYLLLAYLTPSVRAIYTFSVCFYALYAYYRLRKTTGYPSLDAANGKMMKFVLGFALLAISFTVGVAIIQEEVGKVEVRMGFMLGIFSALAAIAALAWWEGPRPTDIERPLELRLLGQVTLLHNGHEITICLCALPYPIEPILNAN